jgi:hypothetical protein
MPRIMPLVPVCVVTANVNVMMTHMDIYLVAGSGPHAMRTMRATEVGKAQHQGGERKDHPEKEDE